MELVKDEILDSLANSALINCALKSFNEIDVSLANITVFIISNSCGSPVKAAMTRSLS